MIYDLLVYTTAGNLWVVSRRIGSGMSRCICRCRVRVLSLARRRRMVHFLLQRSQSTSQTAFCEETRTFFFFFSGTREG